MKTLLFSLMLIATLASCGKDNKVSSATSGNISISNPLVTGSTQGQALTSMISNPASFGQGQIVTGGSSSGQTCGVKWGIFSYCYSSGSSSGAVSNGQTWAQYVASVPNVGFQYSSGRFIYNSTIDIAAKQAELVAILNAATRVDVSGPIYYVTTASAQYVIDTRYTMQMNPSGTLTQSSSEYFVKTN
ncbi:MAG: hypothetical protein H7177_05580 [Rhizobacter sp.]|nr:hypothetical protein [Bacteriovorax sp.]